MRLATLGCSSRNKLTKKNMQAPQMARLYDSCPLFPLILLPLPSLSPALCLGALFTAHVVIFIYTRFFIFTSGLRSSDSQILCCRLFLFWCLFSGARMLWLWCRCVVKFEFSFFIYFKYIN